MHENWGQENQSFPFFDQRVYHIMLVLHYIADMYVYIESVFFGIPMDGCPQTWCSSIIAYLHYSSPCRPLSHRPPLPTYRTWRKAPAVCTHSKDRIPSLTMSSSAVHSSYQSLYEMKARRSVALHRQSRLGVRDLPPNTNTSTTQSDAATTTPPQTA